MPKISCVCGKTTKVFKYDIGDFFVNKCCKEAGYDHLGRKSSDAKIDMEVKPASEEPKTPSKPELPSLEDKTAKELRKLCKRLGCKRTRYMKKAELVDFLLERPDDAKELL